MKRYRKGAFKNLWYSIKRTNLLNIILAQGEYSQVNCIDEQDCRRKLSQLRKHISIQIQKAHRTSNRQYPFYTKVKTLSIKNKERVLKAEKEKS